MSVTSKKLKKSRAKFASTLADFVSVPASQVRYLGWIGDEEIIGLDAYSIRQDVAVALGGCGRSFNWETCHE